VLFDRVAAKEDDEKGGEEGGADKDKADIDLERHVADTVTESLVEE
jgi:hypothetical protein